MYALAARKAKVNAVGILGVVENMPDGNAQRPGDIVTSMSGQTIEVINTDAEGRLVLADAIWYCHTRFKPKILIDLATLTGAIVVALGKDLAGVYGNNEDLAANLMAASKASDDVLWRMPLVPPQYDKLLDSHAADMKNIGPRHGGSITAAMFIQRFVNGVPWAHIDMASTAWKPNFGRAHDPLRRHRLRRAPAGPAVGGLLRGLSHGRLPSGPQSAGGAVDLAGGGGRAASGGAEAVAADYSRLGVAPTYEEGGAGSPARRAAPLDLGGPQRRGRPGAQHRSRPCDRAAGVIFADAILPHPGRSWMETAPPALAEASARPGRRTDPAALERNGSDRSSGRSCCTTGGCARRSPRSCRASPLTGWRQPAPVVEAFAAADRLSAVQRGL